MDAKEERTSQRIYRFWQEHRLKNGEHWSYAAIGRQFRKTRSWVQEVVTREERKRLLHQERAMARALKQAEDNQNANDSLNGE